MGKLKIINPGPLTTIQDEGRDGYMRYGMPTSGAVDKFAFKVANLLVGNNESAAVLETAFLGPEIQFKSDAIIAITGADMQPLLDNHPINMWQAIRVEKGSRLSFASLQDGLRAYIAIGGGIDLPAVMDSKSTYLKAKIGGLEGRKLKEGDVLKFFSNNLEAKQVVNQPLPEMLIPQYSEKNEVKVILGPQDDYFSQADIEKFLNSEYKFSNRSDRMGCMLEGPTLKHKKSPDIISDGIAMGAIQVPGHGKPIIMLSDRQTTGGYAKIANVTTTDLMKVAQAKPGDVISFKAVSVKEAQKDLRKQAKELKQIKEFIQEERKLKRKFLKVKVNDKTYQVEIEEI